MNLLGYIKVASKPVLVYPASLKDCDMKETTKYKVISTPVNWIYEPSVSSSKLLKNFQSHKMTIEELSSLAGLSPTLRGRMKTAEGGQSGGLLYQITGPYKPYEFLKPILSCSPKTQKARGYKALLSTTVGVYLKRPSNYSLLISPSFSLDALNINLSIHDWLKKHGALASYTAGQQAKGFMARPCPSVPRHGFVESRQVFTSGDLKQVIEETRMADPRGEVLVVPWIHATYSSIITDNVVTVGPSNNGATAGIGSVSLPCVSNIRQLLDASTSSFEVESGYSVLPSHYAGLRPKTREPFIEMVQERLVQVRYGPKVSAAPTWAPTPSVFTHAVWEPSQNTLNDFAQFESLLDEKWKVHNLGCVLYLPHGTLTSHAAVQAICKGMPVVTGREVPRPIAGETYRFLGQTRKPFDPAVSKSAHYIGIHAGATATLGNELRYTRGLLWSIGVIQGTATHLHDTNVQKAVLMAAGIILRYGLAACFGEHRHFNDRGPGIGNNATNPVGPIGNSLSYPVGYTQGSFYYNRLSIHTESLEVDLRVPAQMYRILALIEAARSDFAMDDWSGGYGGKKWEACAIATKELLLAWMRVALQQHVYPSPCETTESNTAMSIRRVVQTANTLITVSHNGGKCLTKFVSPFDLINITVAPGLYVAQDLLQYILSRTPKDCTESPWNSATTETQEYNNTLTDSAEEDEDDE